MTRWPHRSMFAFRVKRTWRGRYRMSAFDPKRTFFRSSFNQAYIAPMKCKELLTYLRTYIASNLEDDAGDAVVSDETKGRNLSCQKEERSRQAN